MTYNELQDLCYEKRISLTSVAECADMTLRGFRLGMKNRTLAMSAVDAVCKYLCLTPNDFFGYNNDGVTYNTSMVGENHHNNIGVTGIDILQQQLTIKDNQIKELMELLKKQ